ncbi:ATPase [Qipengyuania sediminis]|uniref:F0F1 ATP synthase subunit B family protein n=1 Tax=Qipengyuania sediminis TaxID=1532023 RepID=UPI001059BFF4|nr:ATPase [Qipengyuania sediminis]
MPQIAQLADTYASQIFWLLVFFGFTFFVVGRGMVPRVLATVEARDTQIAADLAAAQAARDEADRQEEAWRMRENANRADAQALLAKAKAEAAAATEQRLAAAQSRIDARLAEAETRIATARDAAMTEIEAVAVEAAQDIVERLAGVRVAEPQANAAVKEALAHV